MVIRNSAFPSILFLSVFLILSSCSNAPDLEINTSKELYVFPSPTNYAVSINTHIDQSGNLKVISPAGKVVFSTAVEKGDQSFYVYLSDLPTGEYYVILESQSAKASKRFFKI